MILLLQEESLGKQFVVEKEIVSLSLNGETEKGEIFSLKTYFKICSNDPFLIINGPNKNIFVY